jgi:hypothetical protein
MASKKKNPSQSLRHEVSEYTSLIRTLHTSSTRDIVPHLIGVFPPPSQPSRLTSKSQRKFHSRSNSSRNENSQSSDEFKPGNSSSETSQDGDKETSRGNKKRNGISEITEDQDSSTEPTTRRDTWDRWPLLQQSVHVPEWTLQDEVKAIAESAIKNWSYQNKISASNNDAVISNTSRHGRRDKSRLQNDEKHWRGEPIGTTSPGFRSEATKGDVYWDVTAALPDEGLLSQSMLYGLSLEAATFLSHILGLLAAHRPAYDASLQNRLKAIDWETALNILAGSKIIGHE